MPDRRTRPGRYQKRRGELSPGFENLTLREFELLSYYSALGSYKEVAREMGITIVTARNTGSNAILRLGAANIAEAVLIFERALRPDAKALAQRMFSSGFHWCATGPEWFEEAATLIIDLMEGRKADGRRG